MLKIEVVFFTFFIAVQWANAQHAPDWLLSPNLNIVLSVEHETEMRKFYGQTLDLESLPDSHLAPRVGRPFEATMVRFKIGRSEIKMILHEDLTRPPGGRDTAAGLRVLSIPITEGDEIARRVESNTGVSIEWIDQDNYQVAWVRDPDDNEIELRWYSVDAPKTDRHRLELCITTNDIEASASYYGKLLGIPELPAAKLVGFPGDTRRFKAGESVLRLWTTGEHLRSDTGFTKEGYGLRYIQFIARGILPLHETLAKQGATIAQEPVLLGPSNALFFLSDPDGTIIECVGPAMK
jgi:hypothetical protein